MLVMLFGHRHSALLQPQRLGEENVAAPLEGSTEAAGVAYATLRPAL